MSTFELVTQDQSSKYDPFVGVEFIWQKFFDLINHNELPHTEKNASCFVVLVKVLSNSTDFTRWCSSFADKWC